MHNDPEVLAMMAMGEPDIPLAEELHAQQCAECLDELSSLRRVASLARSGSPLEQPLDVPRPEVWGSISSALGFAPEVGPAPFETGTETETAAATAPALPALTLPALTPPALTPPALTPPALTPPAERTAAGGRRPVRSHQAPGSRWSRLRVPVAAGAFSVIVAAGAIFAATDGFAPAVAILAEARLRALPGWAGSSGDAILESTPAGRQVVVTVSQSRTVPGYREVWLISSDLSKLISVGVLSGTTGTFAIPSDVNLADYPIVDVSSEKPDGNPAHSGDSIVRGRL